MEDVIIIGGGASGLRCGVEVAKRGKRCLILDQKEKAGKKLYATGNGKCNFANTELSEDCYRLVASSPDSVWQVIHSDSWKQIAADFQAMGVPAVERQGYLYPRSEQAAAIVQALEQTYLAAGGRLQCQETVTKLCWKSDSCVQVLTDKGSYTAAKIVLAAGGAAASKLGSDGSGYALAKQIGHTVTTCVPALCGLQCSEAGWKQLQGVRAKGSVRLLHQKQCLVSEQGEIQFTQYGVSGIVVFNVSRYAALALNVGDSVELQIDLMPERSAEQILTAWKQMQESCGYRSVADVISGWLPDKLSLYLIKRVRINSITEFSKLSIRQMHLLIQQIKELTIPITGTNTYEQAQVTAGGIPLQEIDMKTMASKIHSNCYCIGEILDVDGMCGGYNLMWAWETGRRAGQRI